MMNGIITANNSYSSADSSIGQSKKLIIFRLQVRVLFSRLVSKKFFFQKRVTKMDHDNYVENVTDFGDVSVEEMEELLSEEEIDDIEAFYASEYMDDDEDMDYEEMEYDGDYPVAYEEDYYPYGQF